MINTSSFACHVLGLYNDFKNCIPECKSRFGKSERNGLARSRTSRPRLHAEQLVADGYGINSKHNVSGWSVLHFLVEEVAIQSARWLLIRGADPNAADLNGWTALLHAIDAESDAANEQFVLTGKYPEAGLVRLLLKFGADPNAKSGNGQSPLELATHYGNTGAIQALREFGGK